MNTLKLEVGKFYIDGFGDTIKIIETEERNDGTRFIGVCMSPNSEPRLSYLENGVHPLLLNEFNLTKEAQ
jgi:hypothetical protein